MSFFDSTPAGRILNRGSVDQSVVDFDIPFRLGGGFASTKIQLIGIVGVMTTVTWQILLLLVPMAIACLWMQKYYMASSRELVRIVSIQKSPIINLFGESIAGAATIRGFGQEKRFMKRNLFLLDSFACMALPMDGVTLNFCICFLHVCVDFCFRHAASMLFKSQNVLCAHVRYKENPPVVLYDITCKFPGGKKIGIVGRTGSEGGRIIIDNIDISKIGLHDLRSRLSIILQDPTLFGGTIRNNLNPLEEHSDHEIWQALNKSQLGDIIHAKERNLDAPVLENGDNWSVGQWQLVSLGRALLKQARILVLDEATASVDSATDNLTPKILQTEFKNCTVCTIAPCIPTVIDSDLVLVLSDGRVKNVTWKMWLEKGAYLEVFQDH
ncbi:hypothetical protein SO802_022414 [Lithocarpus litseifolius]|uniref:Uncharacterized protein n=1 Tax=Lithocarpus litseifolius TaxID=425828 RepID=A0AAW2CJN3_9ROSI